jgi:hypothetical protein
VGVTGSTLTGGTEDDSPYRGAVVSIMDQACTATLIAPDWVVTAAHCVPGLTPSGRPQEIFGWDAGTGPVPGHILRANACYAHPFAAASGDDPAPVPIERCSDTGPAAFIDDEVDVALVHLTDPRSDLPFRPIGPVRGAFVDSGRPFPVRLRGLSTAAGPFTGPLAEGSATLRSTAVLGARALDVTLTAPARVGPGDSGGPLSFGPADAIGPVVGVAGSMGSTTSGTTAIYASLVEPITRDWIWATLDPTGSCELGSAGPCVFRERSAGADVCDDDHCTGNETPTTCPSDCPVAWPDSDGDGLPDVPVHPLGSSEGIGVRC